MKRQHYWIFSFVIALLAMLWTPAATAQKTTANAGPKYDLTTETKLKGVVESVNVNPKPGEGTHLVVRAGGDPILVHIAPENFLKELETSYKPGDEVQVVGSRIVADGVPEVLAKEVTLKNNSLTLRDKKGTPVWQGWEPVKR